MILAAGFGARLLPHTKRMPKPLFPILDKTLLENAIETVKKGNPDRIVINACYLAEQIIEYLNAHDFGLEIIISHEPRLLGTAGGIKYARKWLENDDFIVMNSDIIAGADWEPLINIHRTNNAVATLALRDNPDPAGYGSLSINREKRVTRFLNAFGPDHESCAETLMFTGLSVLSPEIFNFMPPVEMLNISEDIYSPMTRNGEKLFGMKVDWDWVDLGTTDDYHKAVMEMIETYKGQSGDDKPKGVIVQEPVYIETGATIEPGASIGPNVAIHRGAKVNTGSVLKDCVVLPGSVVGKGESRVGEVV